MAGVHAEQSSDLIFVRSARGPACPAASAGDASSRCTITAPLYSQGAGQGLLKALDNSFLLKLCCCISPSLPGNVCRRCLLLLHDTGESVISYVGTVKDNHQRKHARFSEGFACKDNSWAQDAHLMSLGQEYASFPGSRPRWAPDEVECGHHHRHGQDPSKGAQQHGHPHSIRNLQRNRLALSTLAASRTLQPCTSPLSCR